MEGMEQPASCSCPALRSETSRRSLPPISTRIIMRVTATCFLLCRRTAKCHRYLRTAPLEKMTRLFTEMNEWDITLREKEEHRPDFASLVRAHDFLNEGPIYGDENVKISGFLVHDYGAKPAYGFGFETPEKGIVFSAGTVPNQHL